MRRNWLIILVLFVWGYVTAYSQTQEGYVKTLGRPNKKGVALSGVSIKVKGEHNPVLSKNDGYFSMLMTNKKNGDSYSLQEVRKNGYELNEPGIIGRQYTFSDRVPLTIVMVSSSQLQADKQRIENNAFKTAEKNYKAKLALLEDQKEKDGITIENYREELKNLQDKFEKYQLMIDGLAEHYAHVDYDVLDEKGREINTCIENGELEHADSLINQMFDPIEALRRNKEALSKINQQLSQAYEVMDKANDDWAALLKQQEKDAEHLFQLYTIALSRFDNEKARFYIETRAELDTTNVDWQIDAGAFFYQYVGDYDKTLSCNERALRLVKSQSVDAALCYHNIGTILHKRNDYQQALAFYQKAIEIVNDLPEELHGHLVANYNNIGAVYKEQGDVEKALEYTQKALSVLNKMQQKETSDYANCYVNIGSAYYEKADFPKALTYFEKALTIYQMNYGEHNTDVALVYNNIGNVYMNTEDCLKALQTYQKSLDIRLAILDKYHPEVANSYNNIGLAHFYQKEFEEAMGYHQKALDIRQQLYEDHHVDVAMSNSNISWCYAMLERYQDALPYCMKALNVSVDILGKEHPDAINCYKQLNSIADELTRQGLLKVEEKQWDAAVKSLESALNAHELLLETNNSYDGSVIDMIHKLLGDIYSQADAYEDAYRHYLASVDMFRSAFQQDPDKVRDNYSDLLNNLSCFAIFLKDFIQAEGFAREGISVNPDMHIIYTNLAASLLFQGKTKEAEIIYKQYKNEFREGFLDDFQQFEKAGVIPQERRADVEHIKKMLTVGK